MVGSSDAPANGATACGNYEAAPYFEFEHYYLSVTGCEFGWDYEIRMEYSSTFIVVSSSFEFIGDNKVRITDYNSMFKLSNS